METDYILDIDHVKKQFKISQENLEVLNDVDFKVKRGEFISIIGSSGCGKSTLLKLILGLEDITEGSIRIDGSEDNYEKCGMVFQESRLIPWMSTLDNVAFGLQRTKLSKKEKQDIARQQLKLVGLEDFEKARPSQLSGGMQQRVSIARALAGRPEILLLDEPFGALDAFTRINMQKELLNIWENERRTMIMVTHDIDEAIYLSNRVIILADGKVKKEFKVDLGHPRDRGDEDFLRVRGNIYHEFYESSKVMPEYNI